MKARQFFPPVATVLFGIVGFALRKWQRTVGFEPDTDLAVSGNLPARLLILWSALAVVSVLMFLRKGNQQGEPGLFALNGDKQKNLYLLAVLLSAVLLLVSAGLDALTFLTNGQTFANDTALSRAAGAFLPPFRILLCAGGLPAAGLWGKSVYRGDRGRRESLALLELCMLFCVWLISDYQTWAADPVTQSYVYTVFAIVAALLGIYDLAGVSFGEPRPRRALFFALLGVYFSLVTLADRHALADVFRYSFAIIFLEAHAVLLLNPGVTEETKTESDKNG